MLLIKLPLQVYVNDQVHDRIYIPDRTKALISGLNLRKTLRLSIYALSRYGQLSEPAMLEILPQLDHNTNYFDVSILFQNYNLCM